MLSIGCSMAVFHIGFNFAVKMSIVPGLNWFIGNHAKFVKVQYKQLIHI